MDSDPFCEMCDVPGEVLRDSSEWVAAKPVELEHAAAPHVLVVAVVGDRTAGEGHQRAADRRHLGNIVFEVGCGAQYAQAAAAGCPLVVRIEKHGHDLAPMIGVDVPIARLTVATYRAVRVQSGKLRDAEFLAALQKALGIYASKIDYYMADGKVGVWQVQVRDGEVSYEYQAV